jgi:hypothetical protein
MKEYRFVLEFKAVDDAAAENVAEWVRVALRRFDEFAQFELRREEKDQRDR